MALRIALCFFAGGIIFFFVNLWQIVCLPIYLFSVSLYRSLEGWGFTWGASAGYVLSEWAVGGLPYIFSGDISENFPYDQPSGSNFIISNHISSSDWLVNIYIATKLHRGKDIRFFLKKMHRFIPFAGWSCYFHDMIFLSRDYAKDKDIIEAKLADFKKHKTPVWLVLYPEGTFATKATPNVVAKSQAFAKQNNLTVYQNVLTPRTKGFELVMKYRDAFEYISDWTLAFEPYDVRVGQYFPPTLVDLYRRQSDPKKKLKVHIHIKKYKMSEVPENATEWLHKRFDEKEELLEHFRKHGRFPGKQYEHKIEWGMLSWMMAVYVIVIAAFFALLWKYFPKTLMFLLGACAFTGAIIYLYELMHQYLKTPTKQKNRKE